jgi:hypothetical protein
VQGGFRLFQFLNLKKIFSNVAVTQPPAIACAFETRSAGGLWL